ncbi:MAG: YdcF family protein [Oscillospiraceae bacterium]
MWNKLRIIAAALLAVLGLLFRFAITGHDFIGYALLLAAVLVIAYSFLGKKARIILTVLLAVGIIAFGAIELPIIAGARTDKNTDCKYLVVLGAGLHGDVPSLSLTDRLDAALDYLNAHPETVAVVSGGQGPGENMTEAEAMGIWLEARGIAPERIILEPRATSTEENLAFSFDLIRARGDEPSGNTAIVTSEYHLYRAKLMAERQGAAVFGVAGRTSMPSLALNYFIREGFAVAYYKLLGD